MFGHKKEPKVTTYRSTLTIFYRDEECEQVWEESEGKPFDEDKKPWKEFVEWFHGSDKPTFRMELEDGNEIGFTRSMVVRYGIANESW